MRNYYNESREELAEILGFELSTISNYELGYRVPDEDTLKKIAKHFNISLDVLMNEIRALEIENQEELSEQELFGQYAANENLEDKNEEKKDSVNKNDRYAPVDRSEAKKIIKVTMTFGLAAGLADRDKDTLVKIADENLYAGKESGRNKVVAEVIEIVEEEKTETVEEVVSVKASEILTEQIPDDISEIILDEIPAEMVAMMNDEVGNDINENEEDI